MLHTLDERFWSDRMLSTPSALEVCLMEGDCMPLVKWLYHKDPSILETGDPSRFAGEEGLLWLIEVGYKNLCLFECSRYLSVLQRLPDINATMSLWGCEDVTIMMMACVHHSVSVELLQWLHERDQTMITRKDSMNNSTLSYAYDSLTAARWIMDHDPAQALSWRPHHVLKAKEEVVNEIQSRH